MTRKKKGGYNHQRKKVLAGEPESKGKEKTMANNVMEKEHDKEDELGWERKGEQSYEGETKRSM